MALIVWFGGWKPALFASLLGYLGAYFLFIHREPGTPLHLPAVQGFAGLALYRSPARRRVALDGDRQRTDPEREQGHRVGRSRTGARTKFLATLAHELRNPLAPIRQAALIARNGQVSDEQRLWAHSIIERQVQHMSLLLDDMHRTPNLGGGRRAHRASSLRRAPARKSRCSISACLRWTATKWRSRPGGKRVLLVALTGWGQEKDRAASRDAGFDHHLVKPDGDGSYRGADEPPPREAAIKS